VCLIDPDHVVAERYGLINVPSAVWIDEDDRIVRPPDITPVDDLFREFTGIDSATHHAQLRAWVHHGELPLALDAVAQFQNRPQPTDQQARLHRRLGAFLHRRGDDRAAAAHFAAAADLAPWDWTIQRGTMPLTGRDPFGAEFFEFVSRWNEAGAPGYGWGNSALRGDR
jgi:hypothetical protein